MAVRLRWTPAQLEILTLGGDEQPSFYEACPVCGEPWEFGVWDRGEELGDAEPGEVVW